MTWQVRPLVGQLDVALKWSRIIPGEGVLQRVRPSPGSSWDGSLCLSRGGLTAPPAPPPPQESQCTPLAQGVLGAWH